MGYNMIFVLGYDLLQKVLKEYELPCDVAYEVCVDVYNEFLESEYAKQNESEYDALQEYVSEHKASIDYIVEMNSR